MAIEFIDLPPVLSATGTVRLPGSKSISNRVLLLAALADGKTIFYIDINELFDDENGNLRADASGDSTHVYAKYDLDWCDWLCTKAIVR